MGGMFCTHAKEASSSTCSKFIPERHTQEKGDLVKTHCNSSAFRTPGRHETKATAAKPNRKDDPFADWPPQTGLDRSGFHAFKAYFEEERFGRVICMTP
jgi:hypothetical protein